jgi:hypothetical protein
MAGKMKKFEEITFVRDRLTPFELKLTNALREKGYRVNSVTYFELKKELQSIFDKSYYIISKNRNNRIGIIGKILCYFKLYVSLRKIKKNMIIGVSEPNYFVSIIFLLLGRRAISKIYLPYDISYFRYKDYNQYHWCERFCEKYNFRHCDGIVHKGSKDELKYLPKDFKALEKPSLQFLPYCADDLMIKIDADYFQKKLSKKDGNVHLVFVGGVEYNDPAHYPAINVFKGIVKQKLYLHIYCQQYDQLVGDPEYIDLQKNKYFKLHKPIYGKELQKEISKYDWGVEIFFINFEKIKRIWAKTAYSNKISSYLEAGLPIIINSEYEFILKVVKDINVGIIINNLHNIKKELDRVNHQGIFENVLEARKSFSIRNNMDCLISFINDCCRQGNKK